MCGALYKRLSTKAIFFKKLQAPFALTIRTVCTFGMGDTNSFSSLQIIIQIVATAYPLSSCEEFGWERRQNMKATLLQPPFWQLPSIAICVGNLTNAMARVLHSWHTVMDIVFGTVDIFVISQPKWLKFCLQAHFQEVFGHTKLQLSITCAFKVIKLQVHLQ